MTLIYFLLIACYSSFFQSITGFGITVVAAPIALLFLDKTTVVPALIIVGIILNLYLLFKIKSPINKKTLVSLIVASFIGMPFGIAVLKYIPLNQLRIIVGSLSIIFSLALFFSKTKFSQTKFIKEVSGFTSGILQTSTSMSGPPIALFLTGAGVPKDEFRKTLVVYFLIIDIIAIPLFYFTSLLSFESIKFGVFSLPLIIVGAYFGDKVSRKIDQKLFRILALSTIFLTGLLAIYNGLT